MIRSWAILLGMAAISAGLLGCSKSREGRLDNDPANYAKTIKKQVKEFLASAKQNPKGMSQEAAVLLETLEAHSSAPVGDYKSTYELLTQKCKTLVEASKKSTSSSEVSKLLQEMDALANQLPGDVVTSPPPSPVAG
jgi:hypothetical protein